MDVKTKLSIALLSMAMPLYAQQTNLDVSTPKDYVRLSIMNVKTMTRGVGGVWIDGENINPNGFALQLTKGNRLSKEIPAYLELGVSFTYSEWNKYDVELQDLSLKKMSFTVPLNLGYRVVSKEKFSIMPYIGIHATTNFKGEITHAGKTLNALDSTDMGVDGTWNWLEAGVQVGTSVTYNKFVFGLEFLSNFTELCDNCKTSELKISIGYEF